MSAPAAALWRRVRLLALVAVAAMAGTSAHPAGGVAHAASWAPNDPYYAAPAFRWVFTRTGFVDAWSRTLGSASVVVAVVDTGVSATPDLRGALLAGRDVVGGSDDASDLNGHGTEVASVLAARTDNAVGLAGACGRCSVLPVRVAGADGSAAVGDIAAGIDWAVDHGARIVNVSFAVDEPAGVLADAVAYAQRHDVLVVAAAGNDASARADYPAAYDGVLSVEAARSDDTPYPFSNHGAAVMLAAPGCAVVGTRRGRYASACGTSIAAPLVAGAAALLAAAHPDATAAQLADALERGAARAGDARYGRLDVARALALLDGIPLRRR